MDNDDDADYDVMEDVPGLDTEEGRDTWAEILIQQDETTMGLNGLEWARALVAHDDDGNMVIRLRYSDGTEMLYDLLVRRKIVEVGPDTERN